MEQWTKNSKKDAEARESDKNNHVVNEVEELLKKKFNVGDEFGLVIYVSLHLAVSILLILITEKNLASVYWAPVNQIQW